MKTWCLKGVVSLSFMFWSSLGYTVDKTIEYEFMHNHAHLEKVDLALNTFIVLVFLLLVSFLIDVIKSHGFCRCKR